MRLCHSMGNVNTFWLPCFFDYPDVSAAAYHNWLWSTNAWRIPSPIPYVKNRLKVRSWEITQPKIHRCSIMYRCGLRCLRLPVGRVDYLIPVPHSHVHFYFLQYWRKITWNFDQRYICIRLLLIEWSCIVTDMDPGTYITQTICFLDVKLLTFFLWGLRIFCWKL